MFGFFKKKRQEADEPEELSAEDMAVGDRMLEKMGGWDYLTNVSALMTSCARDVPMPQLFGHIHTCIKLGAPAMVSTLAQIAAWRIREYEDMKGAKEHIKEFEQLAMQSAIDCLNYMAANGKQMVYC